MPRRPHLRPAALSIAGAGGRTVAQLAAVRPLLSPVAAARWPGGQLPGTWPARPPGQSARAIAQVGATVAAVAPRHSTTAARPGQARTWHTWHS
jgi:hypothetical protein